MTLKTLTAIFIIIAISVIFLANYIWASESKECLAKGGEYIQCGSKDYCNFIKTK